jgi:hypothetical protein
VMGLVFDRGRRCGSEASGSSNILGHVIKVRGLLGRTHPKPWGVQCKVLDHSI